MVYLRIQILVLSYIVAISFIGGGNRSTWRKPPTCCKSHNVVSSTPDHERDSNLQLLVVIGTNCIGSCKSNYHTITTTTTPFISSNIPTINTGLKLDKLNNCMFLKYFET
jgi:hypothetical protein